MKGQMCMIIANPGRYFSNYPPVALIRCRNGTSKGGCDVHSRETVNYIKSF